MRIIDMRPPRIAMVLTLVAAGLGWSANDPGHVLYSSVEAGLGIGIIGISLMIWSWALFKIENAPICLPAEATVLINEGPYLLSRNPMYLGMILMMFGLAVSVGTLPFYLSAIAYFAIINFVFCPVEEEKLEKAFGDEYREYRKRVRRWF